jgi:sialate O-acetylesterase
MKILLLILLSLSAFAQIKLPSLVSDGMVLQQNQVTQIWGWASPDEKI